MTDSPTPPVALSIAGSDPSGGAGVQADLKVFHHHRVYGAAAVSVLTVQNTRGVQRAQTVDAELVAQQIEAVLEDLPVAAAKTGALGSAAVVEVVAEAFAGREIPLVVDPVLVSSSGRRLLDDDALELLRRRLMPRALLITPNLAEAEALSGRRIRGPDDQREAARALRELGARAVLLKGGHLDGAPVDLLVTEDGVRHARGERIPTRHDHGTGCVLSAAITAELARGSRLDDAVERARRFVAAGLRGAPGLGHGRGPLDLWASEPDPGSERAE